MFKISSMPLLRKLASSANTPLSPITPTASSPSTLSSPASPACPTYRGPVTHSGWVWKQTSRLHKRSIRRFFTLRNSLLSNHPSEHAPPTWTLSVSHSTVTADPDRLLLSLRLPDRELRFTLSSLPDLHTWANALHRASICNLTDFYRLGRHLGLGSFGAVRLATDVSTGARRAVKVIERSGDAKEREFVAREAAVLLRIAHPHIVRTHDVFDGGDRIFVVMDFAPHGDLFDLLADLGALSERDARAAIAQILSGLSYLHARGIVHRDVKPENVLVAERTPLRLQLADFGFANFVHASEAGEEQKMVSVVGTGCYMPPEVIDARGHGRPVDLFAAGVVLFRMLAGVLPFQGSSLAEFYNQAMRAEEMFSAREWQGVSQRARALTAALLDPDPGARPTAEEALRHPWFAGDDVVLDDARPEPGETVVVRDVRGVRIHQSALVSRASMPVPRRRASGELRRHATDIWN